MKHFAVFAVAFTLLISAAQAVTWRVVTISIKVNQGGPEITTTLLNAKKYLEKGISVSAAVLGTPDTDATHYFVGIRNDTGEVAVVHIPSGTKVYNIVSGITLRGVAFSNAGTKGTGAASATISSLNTDFSGFYFDKVTQKLVNGTLQVQSIGRQVMGGSGNQTISGTIRTTAKKFDF
jgi:hypothetical protein